MVGMALWWQVKFASETRTTYHSRFELFTSKNDNRTPDGENSPPYRYVHMPAKLKSGSQKKTESPVFMRSPPFFLSRFDFGIKFLRSKEAILSM
jgi:hypothetical protein